MVRGEHAMWQRLEDFLLVVGGCILAISRKKKRCTNFGVELLHLLVSLMAVYHSRLWCSLLPVALEHYVLTRRTNEAAILLLKFVASSVGICSNKRTDRQPQHCHKMWSYGRKLYFIEDIKDKKAIQ